MRPEVDMPNPYHKRLSASSAQIIGRRDILWTLLDGISGRTPQSYMLVGLRGMGTTALLRCIAGLNEQDAENLCRELRLRDRQPAKTLRVYIDFAEFSGEEPVPHWLLYKMAGHELLREFHPPSAEEAQRPVRAMIDILDACRENGLRVALLLDHLDRALAGMDKSVATQLRPLVSKAHVITATEEHPVRSYHEKFSSWFGNQSLEILLGPLEDKAFGERLLDSASPPGAPHQTSMFRQFYSWLLPLTGLIPGFILRGAAVWWETRHSRPKAGRPDLADLQDLTKYRLLEMFHGDFHRFWMRCSPEEQSCLLALADPDAPDREEATAARNYLASIGLLARRRRVFEPFSSLWGSFLQDKLGETRINAETTRRRAIRPSQREQELLDYLRARPGQVCSHAEILRDVQHQADTPPNRHGLAQEVTRLRKVLERSSPGDRLIAHRSRGYEYRASGDKRAGGSG
jgi:hypothetical protein